MALFSSHTSMVQRSKGQSAVASAAYNARALLTQSVIDKSTNITTIFRYDYSKKEGLAYSKIYAPEDAPAWVMIREKLWNKAEDCELRHDSQTARKIMIALPIELDDKGHIALLEEFALALVAKGMIVDANIHNDNLDNPHAHLMLSTRELKEDRYGNIEFSPIKNREWGKREFVKEHRELWAHLTNKHLAMNGFDLRVSEKSYKDLGLDIMPSVHEGPARNIQNSELVELNNKIAAENAAKIRENPSIIIDILALKGPVFTKEQIAKELEARLTSGVDYTNISDIADIESMQNEISLTYIQLYEHILHCKEIKLVTEADLQSKALYTSTKRFDLETRFIDNIIQMDEAHTHSLNLKSFALSSLSLGEKIKAKSVDIMTNLASRIEAATSVKLSVPTPNQELSEEQSKAVLNILNGSNIAILEGIPGAGKTTAMREIVRQYKKSGRIVIGVAPSSSAALELAKATGIECKNGSKWRKTWIESSGEKFDLILRADYYKEDKYKNQNGVFGPSLTKNHVMIIDEASMVELANMDYLISKAKSVGAKVILVGDNNQLSAVGFAGAFSKASDICKSEKLTISQRQENPLHRQATIMLGQYKVGEALDIFHAEGAINLSDTHLDAINLCAREFVSDYIKDASECGFDDLISRKARVIGVFANKTKASINNQVRVQLKDSGILKGKEYSVYVGGVGEEKQRIDLMRGEQIVFSRNVNHIGKNGVCNGEFATILKIRKPDEDGLTIINLLVYKANGEKEKISLDIARMSQSKWFDCSILFDYGYAVTAHKLQGSSIDNVSVLIEKGVGFEVFNVLATRHRKNVLFYSNRELIESSFFGSFDKSMRLIKRGFKLESDGNIIFKEGLIKLLSKRTNTSFAHDYSTIGMLSEDKMIKRYLDESQSATLALQAITSWQDTQNRKTGIKPKMWDHHDFWSSFQSCRARRAIAAAPLEQDYERFKNRLIQLRMNYSTILKHANHKQSSFKQADRAISDELKPDLMWQTKPTILHQQDPFKDLVSSVSRGLNRDIIHKDLINVNLYIDQTITSIDKKDALIFQLDNARSELQNAIINENHFRDHLTPEYLSRIFQNPNIDKKNANKAEEDLSSNNGAEVFDRYKKLVGEHGEEAAVNMVISKPTILGELQGYGIGRVFAIGKGRRDSIELCKNIGESLRSWHKSKDIINEYNQQLQDGNFDVNISKLKEEVQYLRSLLPAQIDKEFLQEVKSKLSDKNKEIDWSNLQNSELFKAIDSGQYINKHMGSFQEEKISSRNCGEVIEIMKQEQEYLSSLHGNLKFEKYHGPELVTSIEQARALEKNNKDSDDNIFDQIDKLTTLHIDKMGANKDDLTNAFKQEKNPYSLHKSLLDSYQNHVIRIAQKALDNIYENKPVQMNEQYFTCQIKFLDYLFERQVHNEFLPRENLQQAYSILLDSKLKGGSDKSTSKESMQVATKLVLIEPVSSESENKNNDQNPEKENNQRDSRIRLQKEQWNRNTAILRDEVRFNAEKIAIDILGVPNKKLSNPHTLRFGSSGKIAVCIRGERRGNWIDFSSDKSGDMFHLVQDKFSYDFKSSAEYLRSLLALEQENESSPMLNCRKSSILANYADENAKETLILEAKQRLVDKLYLESKTILAETVAQCYLANFRNINTKVGIDIRTSDIYHKEEALERESEENINISKEEVKIDSSRKNNYLPAIVAFARNNEGKITGGQQILLDKNTGSKANVGLVKKSFGKISGSFVETGKIENSEKDLHNSYGVAKTKSAITIIAEGLETALSVKQALEVRQDNNHIEIKVLCSLGISNIKNYQPTLYEKIIIAADNDGFSNEYNEASDGARAHNRAYITEKTINNAKLALEQKGGFVEIVRPDKEGDFNDILKTEGTIDGQKIIAQLFTPSIVRHSAATIEEYFVSYHHKDSDKNMHLNISKGFDQATSSRNDNNAQEPQPNITSLDKQEIEDLAFINKYNMAHDKILTSYRTSPLEGKLELEQLRKTLDFAKACYQDNQKMLVEAKEYGYQANEIELIKSLSYMGKEEASQFCAKIRDDHYIGQHKEQTYKARALATTPNEVIDAITQYQNFVANLERNLKYPEGQARFLKFVPIAKDNLDDKLSEKLKQVVSQSILVGVNSRESLLNELKTTRNSRATYEKLGGEIESRHINMNIESFKSQRQKALDRNEITDLMKEEQEYLGSLHGNLKFEKYHGPELVTSIEKAYENQNKEHNNKNNSNNLFDQIDKLATLHTDKMGINNDDLTNSFKQANDPHSLHKSLLDSYQKHVIKIVQKRLDDIHEDKPVKMNGQYFTCQIKFLDHLLERQAHNEFLPRANIQQTHARLVEHNKQHETSKGFDGPDM